MSEQPVNPAPQETTPATTPEKKDSPWSHVGYGLFLVALGVGLYFLFNHWEQEGGRMKMNAIVLLVYNFLGKWGVLGVFGGLGAALTLFGINSMLKGNKPS
ncbi:MAG TPA: hypothetical protein PLX97_05045 [Gemmatales bacterium]|nr:hypothetical protein [Gemmatales bacterium]